MRELIKALLNREIMYNDGPITLEGGLVIFGLGIVTGCVGFMSVAYFA